MVLNRREAIDQLLRRDGGDGTLNCGSGGGDTGNIGLRIASVFIILIGSLLGALFPVFARRARWLSPHVPKSVFEFGKYFGSGIIIATAFIHLLDPAIEELGSPCLSPGWSEYPYAIAIALIGVIIIFITELIAFRWGTAKLASIGVSTSSQGQSIGCHARGLEDPELNVPCRPFLTDSANTDPSLHSSEKIKPDVETNVVVNRTPSLDDSPATQIIGVMILEFGILLHSVLIGLTLAVTDDFITLFIVIIFHQAFEGLGVGSRLAYMELPEKYLYVPVVGAILYGITTPIGIAIGIGVRTTYNPNSTTASLVSGILDAFSAGILIYTGLVELLAHEFLFCNEMITSSHKKLAYAIGCMMLGCGIMALLGKWA